MVGDTYGQNRPNSFNSRTMIRFSLSTTAVVEMYGL
jgi:hypothetical protein